MYKIIYDWEAKALIPPAITSKSQDELKAKRKMKSHLKQRDNRLKAIIASKDFKIGLKQWKIESGYHRTKKGLINEMITKINLLNQMTILGKPQYAL